MTKLEVCGVKPMLFLCQNCAGQATPLSPVKATGMCEKCGSKAVLGLYRTATKGTK